MKKVNSLIFVLLCSMMMCLSSKADVTLNSTNFPDAAFRSYISTLTKIADGGTLTSDIISKVTAIECNSKSIANMKGIENFTNLTMLTCASNNLTAGLDLSQNTALTSLNCSSCGLTSLNLSANTALKNLTCSYNALGTLNLTSNAALVNVDCRSCSLTTLTLGTKPALTDINCSTNSLSTLDIANCSVIKNLDCQSNPLVTFTQVNPTLESIICESCQLTSLTLLPSANLKVLNCRKNSSLSSLDVTKNTGLTKLSIQETNISTIDLTKCVALTDLNCWYAKLTALDISQCKELASLNCSNNKISSIDFSNNSKLSFLQCASTLIETLDLTPCKLIGHIEADNSNIKSLKLPTDVDVPLTWLDCVDGKLTTLDLSHAPNIWRLTIYGNKLNALDLSKNTKVTNFEGYGCGRAIKVYTYDRNNDGTVDGYYIPLEAQTGDHPTVAIGTLIDNAGQTGDPAFDLSKVDQTTWSGATPSTINGAPVLLLDTSVPTVSYSYKTGFTGTAPEWNAGTAWNAASPAAPNAAFFLTWSPTDIVSGVDGVETTGVNVFTSAGTINVGGSFNGNVNVYNLRGQQVYCGANSEIAVPAGMYIVKVDGAVHKVLVK
jgi:hypothetical protein